MQKFEIGDTIRIIDIPEEDKDLSRPDDPEMRTHELFRFCLGKQFRVRAVDKESGTVELTVSDNKEVRRIFGDYHTIWIESKFVVLIRRNGRNKG